MTFLTIFAVLVLWIVSSIVAVSVHTERFPDHSFYEAPWHTRIPWAVLVTPIGLIAAITAPLDRHPKSPLVVLKEIRGLYTGVDPDSDKGSK